LQAVSQGAAKVQAPSLVIRSPAPASLQPDACGKHFCGIQHFAELVGQNPRRRLMIRCMAAGSSGPPHAFCRSRTAALHLMACAIVQPHPEAVAGLR